MSNRRKQNNYFEYQIKRFGTNFLQSKNSRQLQFDAARIFRDISKGRLDVRDYSEYFKDTQLQAACITTATTKLSLHSISSDGVMMLMQQRMGMNTDQLMMDQMNAVYEYHRNLAEAYSLILEGLTYLRNTGNVNHLSILSQQLRKYYL